MGPRRNRGDTREAVRTAAFWILVVMGFATFFVHAGVNVHIAAYLRDEGLSLTNAAWVVTASWVVSAAGSVAWGWLMERGAGAADVFGDDGHAVGSGAAAVAGERNRRSVRGGGAHWAGGRWGEHHSRRGVRRLLWAGILGQDTGFGETGVLVGQSTGPLLAGLAFDLQGSYSLIFLTYSAIAAAGACWCLYARRPVRGTTSA